MSSDSRGFSTMFAWFAWSVSVVAFLMSVVLMVENAQYDGRGSEVLVEAIEDLAFVAIATLALLILRSQPSNVVGWWIMLAGVTFPVEGFLAEFTQYGLRTWGQIGVVLFTGWVSRWVWIGAQLAVPLILLYYPNGRLPSRRWRGVVVFLWTVAGLGFLGMALNTAPVAEFGNLPNPIGVEAVMSVLGPIAAVALFGMLILPLLGALSVIPRYRRSVGVERQQMKLIAWVGAVALVFFAVPQFALSPLVNVIMSTVFTVYVGATLTAGIVRYRLFEIDRIISRTVTYAAVIATLAIAFFGLVTFATAILPSQNSLAVAASTLAVAALFNPLRRRIQTSVNRRFNRSGYQVETVSDQFAVNLRASLTVEEIADAFTGTVDQALQPSSMAFWLNRSHPPEANNPPTG